MRNSHKTFLIFLLVGALTSALYFCMLKLTLGLLGLGYAVAVTISYVVAISFHFLANRIATFQATHENPLGQGARYLVMAGINYLLTMLIVSFVFKYLGISVYWGALLALTVTTALGFVISKNWIFKNRKPIHE